jgi:hypothetical protein
MLGLDFTSLAEELLHGYGKMVVTLIKSNGGKENLTTQGTKKIVPEYRNITKDLMTGLVTLNMFNVNVNLWLKTTKCA